MVQMLDRKEYLKAVLREKSKEPIVMTSERLRDIEDAYFTPIAHKLGETMKLFGRDIVIDDSHVEHEPEGTCEYCGNRYYSRTITNCQSCGGGIRGRV